MGAPVVSITEPPIAPVAPPWPYVRAPKSKVASRNTTPKNLRTTCIVIPHPELSKNKTLPRTRVLPVRFPNALYRTIDSRTTTRDSGEHFPAFNVAIRIRGVKKSEDIDFRSANYECWSSLTLRERVRRCA